MRSRMLFSVLAALLIASLSVPATAQEEVFVDRVEVRVVEVEVVVVDSQGNRVEGLTRDDFHLRLDGQEVPLEFFEEVRRGASLERIEGAAVTTAPVEAIADPAQGRSFLFFFDETFMDMRSRNVLLKRLDEELAMLRPADRVAVARYSGAGLDVLTEWTDDADAVREIFKSERKHVPAELKRRTELAATSDPQQREVIITEQIRGSATALAIAMRTFADAPGRKLLLPVASGWPFQRESAADALVPGASDGTTSTGGEPGLGPIGDPFQESLTATSAVGSTSEVVDLSRTPQYRGFRLLEPMFDTANRLGYTIYPYIVGEPCAPGSPVALAGSPTAPLCVEGYEISRQSLKALAQETGGVLAGDGATTRAPFANVLGDTEQYYLLAFNFDDAVPGERSRIQVAVERPGLEIRHRRSVLELSSAQQASLDAEQALLLGTVAEGSAGQGTLELVLGEPQKKRNRVRLPMAVKIPLDFPTLVPIKVRGQEARQLDLELRVAALDEKGERSEVPVVPIKLQIPPPPPNVHITYEAVVELRNASQRLAVTLHDKLSGEALSTVVEVGP